MKGVLLAGGTGSRLLPLTKVTNKHLLPIYHKPMIYYPLETLKSMGISEILIVTGGEHLGDISGLLGSGDNIGVKLSYRIQEGAGGIAQALSLAEQFASGDSIAVILGDNVYEDDININGFSVGAKVFLKEVSDPERFGVAEIKGNKIIGIEEKPGKPKSKFAVTGLYIYDNSVFEIIKTLKPSDRGELEITDVNNSYIKRGELGFEFVKGFWTDAGTFESLHRAGNLVRNSLDKTDDPFSQK
jgi:glucose-1-phosphate thymidylyltransferase